MEPSRGDVAERRRADDSLRDEGHDARLIINGIPALVALLGASGELEVVNRRLLEYSGRTLNELRQWATSDIVHAEDLPGVIAVFTRSIAAGIPYEIAQRLRRSDGVYRWFLNSGFPLRDPDGRVYRWCVLLTDIDERKRAEDALKQSERALKLTIDSIPALVWSARPDGSAEFFNAHYLDFIGFSADEASGWGWTSAVHPDDRSALVQTWQRILDSGQSGEAEARLRRREGAYLWFLFRANPVRDDTGAIVRWYGLNTDIEARKRAEQELAQEHGQLAEAQRLSRTGSFIVDPLADEGEWSEEAFRIFEFAPDVRLSPAVIRATVHAEDLAAFDAAAARAAAGREWDVSFRIVTSRGTVKHVHAVGHVMQQAVGGREVHIGAIQDVTANKAADDALNRARSELAHVTRATSLSTLTASIAHEVSQPLSGIITNASTCLRMLDAETPNIDGARETARRTLRDGNRAADIIARLRTLFSGRTLAQEPVDLSDIAREVVALSLSDLQRNRVILRCELADDLPSIAGDRVQLQEVIANLLRNASDAMASVEDRPRDLVVRTEREGQDRVRLIVQDVGLGVDDRSVDELFDPFYTTKSDGMGIGLSVSRSIVKRHQGRIVVLPNAGPGTTFAVSLPIGAAGARQPAPSDRTSS